jgi:hypothetical protein
MTPPSWDDVINCGGPPRCGRCVRCRQLAESTQSLDPTERLLAEQAQAGPKVSWGQPASPAEKRRRETDRLLEKHGLKPLRW